MAGQPFDNQTARRLIGHIARAGAVGFTRHARDEMAQDGLLAVDVINVLRAGLVEFSEERHGSFRYRVYTRKLTVVVAFRSAEQLAVVTAWRSGRR
jgi:hypothetical protein